VLVKGIVLMGCS